ncbi:MAG: pyruvate kinase, partial [Solirubrobacterales bacterium]
TAGPEKMSPVSRRRTKIVATVGPASRSPETLVELIEAGADVFRLNFSHGDREEHLENIARIRAAAATTGRDVAILGDLPGPKLRLGDIEGDVAVLHSASQVVLDPADGTAGTAERLPVQWAHLPSAVKEGDPVFLADGRVRLLVIKVEGDSVTCEVEAGGAVGSHQGLNLPGADEEMPATGAADEAWIEFAAKNGIDLLAVSFVRRASDVEKVAADLKRQGADIPLIAKIEKPQAAARAEELVDAVDGGIMVARGDLGVELPLEEIPSTQKRLIALAGRRSKPSITATQMLATMVRANRPTRAEVTDVANAIYDGTDAVMLSEETAIGDHPVEAVRVMDRIAGATERDLPYGEWLHNRAEEARDDIAATVAQVTVAATYRLDLAAIVVPTASGRTARLVSACRPRVPVLAVSSSAATTRRMNLLFGVSAVLADPWDSLSRLLDDCATLAREQGIASSGDLIAITAGLPQQQMGTNLFEVHRVP